jgi:hypothetical protein
MKIKNSVYWLFFVIGLALIAWWGLFLFSFILALGQDGDPGDLARWGVYLIKEKTLVSILSLIYAGFTAYKLKRSF